MVHMLYANYKSVSQAINQHRFTGFAKSWTLHREKEDRYNCLWSSNYNFEVFKIQTHYYIAFKLIAMIEFQLNFQDWAIIQSGNKRKMSIIRKTRIMISFHLQTKFKKKHYTVVE